MHFEIFVSTGPYGARISKLYSSYSFHPITAKLHLDTCYYGEIQPVAFLGNQSSFKTKGPWTLARDCLTLATGVTNGNFLQTYFIVTYGPAPLQDIRLRNLSDLEFDLLRSLKVKCDSVIELPIYAFLLMFNSNIWPNYAPLQDIRLQNLSDLVFDLLKSLKVKCDDVIGLVIHSFLLICTVITCLTLTI